MNWRNSYWQDINNMKFNGSKFELIRYGTKEDIKENTVYFTPGHDDVIDQKENIKELGISRHETLKTSPQ